MGYPQIPFLQEVVSKAPEPVYGKNYDYMARKVKGIDKYNIYRRLTDLDEWVLFATVPSFVGTSENWELHDTIYSPLSTHTGKVGARRQIYE